MSMMGMLPSFPAGREASGGGGGEDEDGIPVGDTIPLRGGGDNIPSMVSQMVSSSQAYVKLLLPP